MNFKGIAVLTSSKSWFIPYAQKLVKILKKKGHKSKIFYKPTTINKNYEIVFMLSYNKIVRKYFLQKHRHNLVIHESNLPKGKGWSPAFWQILEGKNKIPIVLFEATEEVDAGNVYIKDYLILRGDELYDEIRKKQANKTIKLCLKFLENYKSLRLIKQRGKQTFYKRRFPKDSKLNINKSIKDQFNLLRIVSNKDFPAFFNYNDNKYVLKIFKSKSKKLFEPCYNGTVLNGKVEL